MFISLLAKVDTHPSPEDFPTESLACIERMRQADANMSTVRAEHLRQFESNAHQLLKDLEAAREAKKNRKRPRVKAKDRSDAVVKRESSVERSMADIPLQSVEQDE